VKPVIIIAIAFFLLIPTSVFAEEIPSWIKNNADWWAQGLISDKDFAAGLGYLVKEGVIKVDNVEFDSEGSVDVSDDIQIPKWIHNNARWWADGAISDDDFKSGIQFIIKEGIVQFKESSELQTTSVSKKCNSAVDKNNDGKPDDLIPQRGIDWSFCNLQGVSLVGQDLGQANLMGADLRGANLQNADLTLANLANADLRNAKLIGANMLHSNLNNANLYQANLLGVNLYAANLQDANLKEAILIQANVYKSNLIGAIFVDADLKKANFCGQVLYRQDFSGADFTGADLSKTKLKNVNFESTILIDANLSGADLTGVNLINLHLKSLFLKDAHL